MNARPSAWTCCKCCNTYSNPTDANLCCTDMMEGDDPWKCATCGKKWTSIELANDCCKKQPPVSAQAAMNQQTEEIKTTLRRAHEAYNDAVDHDGLHGAQAMLARMLIELVAKMNGMEDELK